MTDQLILKFPAHKAYKKEDFYVSSSNQEAYDFINSWPNWLKRIVNIFGPTGSGKSHLASILKSKTKCLEILPEDLNVHISILSIMALKDSPDFLASKDRLFLLLNLLQYPSL